MIPLTIMGTSPSLIEHKDYYDTGELEYHFYMFNEELCGLFRTYYKNGTLMSISNHGDYYLSRRLMCFYENGMLRKETCLYDENKYYKKVYADKELLRTHYFNTNLGFLPNTQYYAKYVDGNISLYYIEHFGLINYTNDIIYNVADTLYDKIINIAIIHSIRIIQKQFRKRTYSKRFDILNSIIDIDDISHVILSYL